MPMESYKNAWDMQGRPDRDMGDALWWPEILYPGSGMLHLFCPDINDLYFKKFDMVTTPIY